MSPNKVILSFQSYARGFYGSDQLFSRKFYGFLELSFHLLNFLEHNDLVSI